MRVYHFLPAIYALENLKRSRLKIATFNDLNDPFELWAAAQPNPKLRRGLQRFKARMTLKFGILCFSLDWHNPVMWGHYANRHRGMVLGFDTDLGDNVRYAIARPPLKSINETTAQMLLYTKHKDWSYEQEHRVVARLENRDPKTGLYFASFGTNLVLREVITGPLCIVDKGSIEAVLHDSVRITKSRLAFKTFRVVTDLRGFRATPR